MCSPLFRRFVVLTTSMSPGHTTVSRMESVTLEMAHHWLRAL